LGGSRGSSGEGAKGEGGLLLSSAAKQQEPLAPLPSPTSSRSPAPRPSETLKVWGNSRLREGGGVSDCVSGSCCIWIYMYRIPHLRITHPFFRCDLLSWFLGSWLLGVIVLSPLQKNAMRLYSVGN